MVRNLKVLLLAGLALLAVGAVSASSASAHAAATKFTVPAGGNTTVTTEPDGAVGSTTAHQVFDVEGNGAITAKKVELTGTVTGTEPAEVILSEKEETKTGFVEATFLGQPAVVTMHKCDFTFTPAGDVKIVGCGGDKITFTVGSVALGTHCLVEVHEQATFVGAAKYGNVGTTVTAEVATGLNAVVNSTVSGPGCISTGTKKGTYTTGNTILKGLSDDGLKTAKTIAVD